MKKIICSVAFILLIVTQSCKDDKLVEFARDVIDHPEKLYNLQKNYPEFYNPDYIYTKWQDSVRIGKMVNFINEYNKIDQSEKINFLQADKSEEVMLNAAKGDYKLNELFMLIIQKREKQITFYLIKKDNRYYFHFISGGKDAFYIYFPEHED